MEAAMGHKGNTRTRSIAFCGLTIALLAVSAWITVPFGPVPFTLQVFVMVFALFALSPRECLVSIAGYLLLGAIGLPVFSAMRGGIGVILGPSGGFLWGYLIGAIVALLVMRAIAGSGSWLSGQANAKAKRDADSTNTTGISRRKELIANLAGAVVFIVIMYICGWVQLMAVAGMSPAAAFVSAIAPFVVVDIIKTAVAFLTARAVKRAVR